MAFNYPDIIPIGTRSGASFSVACDFDVLAALYWKLASIDLTFSVSVGGATLERTVNIGTGMSSYDSVTYSGNVIDTDTGGFLADRTLLTPSSYLQATVSASNNALGFFASDTAGFLFYTSISNDSLARYYFLGNASIIGNGTADGITPDGITLMFSAQPTYNPGAGWTQIDAIPFGDFGEVQVWSSAPTGAASYLSASVALIFNP